ncbi:MAG: hypothetical protein HY554_13075 [Elusimicrobia bacterium]|nr:hypothetical protein [Elusimicrobiota bacterium]
MIHRTPASLAAVLVVLLAAPAAAQQQDLFEALRQAQRLVAQHEAAPAPIASRYAAFTEVRQKAERAQGLLKSVGRADPELDALLGKAAPIETALTTVKMPADEQEAAMSRLAQLKPSLERRANVILYGSAAPAAPGEHLLPDALPSPQDYVGQKHLIFVDANPNEKLRDSFLKNKDELVGRLLAIGVPASDIAFYAVTGPITGGDFFATIEAVKGPKRVYHIGHAAPLTLQLGTGCFSVRDAAARLCAAGVSALASNGCSFGKIESPEIARFAETMPRDAKLCLYGFDREVPASKNGPYEKGDIQFHKVSIERSGDETRFCKSTVVRAR